MYKLILIYEEVHFIFSSYFCILEVFMEKLVKTDPIGKAVLSELLNNVISS